MKRYVDTFFRFWWLILLPVVALPLAEASMVLREPKTNVATANIFVQQSVLLTSGTGPAWESPAQSEVSNLGQWMQSPSFALRVAAASPLFAESLTGIGDRGTLASDDLQLHAAAVLVGNNLVRVTYTNANAGLAAQVVSGILAAARANTQTVWQQQASLGIEYYSGQYTLALQAQQHSAASLQAYMTSHNIDPADLQLQTSADPALNDLYQQNRSDQANATAAQQKLTGYKTQASIPASLADADIFSVIDPPRVAYVQTSLRKKLQSVALGLAVGLLLAAGFVVALVALDRTVRFADEAQQLFGLPVLGVVPFSGVAAEWQPAAQARALPGTAAQGRSTGLAQTS